MNIPAADRDRIEKLKTLRDDPAATPGERANAQAAIDRIMARNGYRRKAKPDPEPAPGPAQPMTFADMCAAFSKAGVELNEALGNLSTALGEFDDLVQEIINKSGNVR